MEETITIPQLKRQSFKKFSKEILSDYGEGRGEGTGVIENLSQNCEDPEILSALDGFSLLFFLKMLWRFCVFYSSFIYFFLTLCLLILFELLFFLLLLFISIVILLMILWLLLMIFFVKIKLIACLVLLAAEFRVYWINKNINNNILYI